MSSKWSDRKEELRRLRNEGYSIRQIADKFGETYDAVFGALKRYNIYLPPSNDYEMSEEEMRQRLSKAGYRVEKKEEAEMDKRFKIDPSMCEGKETQFAVISCTHLGSRYQQISYLKTFYQYIQDYLGVKIVLHAGDLVDGIDVYRGHEYEIFTHGADAQRDYAVENYPRMNNGGKTFIVGGNHDFSFIKKANTDVLQQVSKERDDIEYLGVYGAYPKIDDLNIYLQHGEGGVSYARSYKLQKKIEQMSPDVKPDLYFLGHYHATCALFEYRNVTAFTLPCFQAQTPYLRRKGLYPEIGGFVFTVQTNDISRKKGIAQFDWRFIPFYIPKEKDY